jgi:arylsulfatase A-like enzyme
MTLRAARTWLRLAWVSVTLCLLVLSTALTRGSASIASAPAKAPRPPNFLLVLVDDQAQNSFKRAYMPRTFEQIVARGTRFTNGLAAPPLCCPDRAGILTGQYPHNHGVFSNRPGYGDLRDRGDTLPVWLNRAGYRTGLIGKFLNGYPAAAGAHPAPGFDRWFSYLSPISYYRYRMSDNGTPRLYGRRRHDYSTDVFTRKAVSFLRQSSRTPSQPFFLWLAYNAPHRSGSSLGPCKSPGSADPPDRAALRAFNDVPLPRPASFNERDVSDKPARIRSLPRLNARAVRNIKRNWHCTLGTVSQLDNGVGRVMAELKRDRALRNTIVIFMSDNGYFFGEHRRRAGKGDVYEPALNVPFAIRVPAAYRRGARKSRIATVVTNQDVAPTLLDYASRYVDSVQPCATATDCRRIDGRSLIPLLDGQGGWPRDRGVLVEINEDELGYRAVRTRRYAYSSLATGERELYDLKRDPAELRNVHGRRGYAVVEQRLAARLALLRECSGIKGRNTPTAAPFCE